MVPKTTLPRHLPPLLAGSHAVIGAHTCIFLSHALATCAHTPFLPNVGRIKITAIKRKQDVVVGDSILWGT